MEHDNEHASYENTIARLDAKARQDQLDKEKEEAEKAKKNLNFVQIEKRNLKAFRMLAIESPTCVAVMFALAEHMNRQNAVMISYEALEFLTGYARATLSKAIRMLEEKKWIQIVKVGNANAYLINSGAFWQSYGNRKYTSFHAQIVAIDKEQTKPVEEMAKVKLQHFPIVEVDERVLLTGKEEPPANAEIDLE